MLLSWVSLVSPPLCLFLIMYLFLIPLAPTFLFYFWMRALGSSAAVSQCHRIFLGFFPGCLSISRSNSTRIVIEVMDQCHHPILACSFAFLVVLLSTRVVCRNNCKTSRRVVIVASFAVVDKWYEINFRMFSGSFVRKTQNADADGRKKTNVSFRW